MPEAIISSAAVRYRLSKRVTNGGFLNEINESAYPLEAEGIVAPAKAEGADR
jgi:hypothetical protein